MKRDRFLLSVAGVCLVALAYASVALYGLYREEYVQLEVSVYASLAEILLDQDTGMEEIFHPPDGEEPLLPAATRSREEAGFYLFLRAIEIDEEGQLGARVSLAWNLEPENCPLVLALLERQAELSAGPYLRAQIDQLRSENCGHLNPMRARSARSGSTPVSAASPETASNERDETDDQE